MNKRNITEIIGKCIDNSLRIIENINKEEKVFRSEKDFQFNLSIEFKKYFSDVILEYNNINLYADENKHMIFEKNTYINDILIRENENYYPIELKYSANGYGIDNQGSICYKFVEDIKKIESLKSKKISSGYCILLTNEEYIFNPDPGWLKKRVYKDFELSKSRIELPSNQELKWGTSNRPEFEPIRLNNSYKIGENWKESINKFYFLLVEVEPCP
jgi:hypothetical protein